MATFLTAPAGSLTAPGYLTPRERVTLDRAPRLTSGPPPQGWTDPQLGAAEGLAAYVAGNGVRAEQTRMPYVDKAHRLHRNASSERSALKEADRKRTPASQRAAIRRVRPSNGPPPGTSGAANHTNLRVTEQALAMGRLGRASLVGSALLGGAEVIAAEDKPRAAASVGGGMAGGWAGGVAGAEAGAVLGPWGALGGGIVGAIAGGALGHGAGSGIVDHAPNMRRR
ncbi:hypothetical protein [uncultured Phenylobacterium sp.]|uniref:hypothetical protein n=1 Tax=uncultured Phenylobacterium sp. TaxID=349273 RepID=UPI0025F113C9|nr:hypothetical protein [uncultured Phenylobacterium sp.]